MCSLFVLSIQQTIRIHDEISTQNWKANQMEAQFVNTKGSLRKETESIAEVRHMGDGICWMYGVIALQVVGTIFLLYVGLSRWSGIYRYWNAHHNHNYVISTIYHIYVTCCVNFCFFLWVITVLVVWIIFVTETQKNIQFWVILFIFLMLMRNFLLKSVQQTNHQRSILMLLSLLLRSNLFSHTQTTHSFPFFLFCINAKKERAKQEVTFWAAKMLHLTPISNIKE